MEIPLYLSILFAMLYGAIMISYHTGWRKLPEKTPEFSPPEFLTVLIPARNESANIANCLNSIIDNNYPKNQYEIIIIDDHSADDTPEIVRKIAEKIEVVIHCLALKDHLNAAEKIIAYKKKALELGVRVARGDIILTTDADCIVGADWLQLHAACYHKASNLLVTGPVLISGEQNLLQRFQSLDLLGMMGITGGGIYWGFQRMGNGANMSYRKAAFSEIGGYRGNEHIASGDDLFLLQKMEKMKPGSVRFLKNREAAVHTNCPSDFKGFLMQRLRWAAKNAALPEWPVRLILLSVFLFCWMIFAIGMLSCFQSKYLILLFGLLAIKMFFDFIFLREICRYFQRSDLMRWFLPAFFIHIAYIAGVGALGIFWKRYTWKGR